MNKLVLAIVLFFAGQTLIWIQTNGQFLWKWFDKNPLILSIVFGTIISYIFIFATKYAYQYFDNLIWPGKFVGFSTGIICYAILTYLMMSEGMSAKTLVSLLLATLIIIIQIVCVCVSVVF